VCLQQTFSLLAQLLLLHLSSHAQTHAHTQHTQHTHHVQDNEECTQQLLELLDALATVDGDVPAKWSTLRKTVVTLVSNNCVLAPQLPPRSRPPTAGPTAGPTVAVTSESETVSAETAAAAGGGDGSARPSASDIAVSTTHIALLVSMLYNVYSDALRYHYITANKPSHAYLSSSIW
jgi:hypothetical protein